MTTIKLKKTKPAAPEKQYAPSYYKLKGLPQPSNDAGVPTPEPPQPPVPPTVPPPEPPSVATVFGDEFGLPTALANAPFTGSKDQLLEITNHVAAVVANEFFNDKLMAQKAPTVSAITSKVKATQQEWWNHLTTEISNGPDANDGALKNAIFKRVKDTFDAASHKYLTGHDLPDDQQTQTHSPMAALRKATGHGDATLFLYRVRYWWPRAVVTQEGKKWIAKSHEEWAEELSTPLRSFRTAYDRLKKLGLIESGIFKFKGVPTLHVRPTAKGEKLIVGPAQ